MPEIALACQMEDFRKIISAAQIAMIMGMPMKMALLYALIVIVTLAISAALRVEASIEGEGAADNQATGIINSWENILASRDKRELWHYNSDDDFDETKRLKATAPSFSPFVRHEP